MEFIGFCIIFGLTKQFFLQAFINLCRKCGNCLNNTTYMTIFCSEMQPGNCFGLFCLFSKMHMIFLYFSSALIFFDGSTVSFQINTALETKITPHNKWDICDLEDSPKRRKLFLRKKIILAHRPLLKESIKLILEPFTLYL